MERLRGGLLQPQIDRRLNRQAVLVELLGAVSALELAAHFLEEVGCGRRRLSRGIGANHDRFLLQFLRLRRRDVADLRHPAEGVVAAPERRLAIHIRALADVGLEDAGDEGRLLDRDVLRRLAEVEPRRRLDAVDAVPEIHLVAVEREDLALGVALLDLDREDRFLDFSFRCLVIGQEQLAGELLGQRARAVHATLDDVLDERDDDARDAEPDVLIEPVVFGREDGLLEVRRDPFVGDDFSPFDREFADDFAAGAVHARDRARRVVVEGRDAGEVTGIGEDDPGRDSQSRGEHEERDDACRRASETQNDVLSSPASPRTVRGPTTVRRRASGIPRHRTRRADSRSRTNRTVAPMDGAVRPIAAAGPRAPAPYARARPAIDRPPERHSRGRPAVIGSRPRHGPAAIRRIWRHRAIASVASFGHGAIRWRGCVQVATFAPRHRSVRVGPAAVPGEYAGELLSGVV